MLALATSVLLATTLSVSFGSWMDTASFLESRGIPGGGRESNTATQLPFHIEDSVFCLGPGDQLSLRWWGVGSGSEILTVNPEGQIVIPDLGTVQANGRVLREVRDSIKSVVHRKLRPRLIDIQVRSVSPAWVGVSGSIPTSGVFKVAPGSTLLEVLKQAGMDVPSLVASASGTMPRVEIPELRNPSVRRTRIVRATGKDTLTVDLATTLREGDPGRMVRLFSGDQVILLPPGRYLALSGQAATTGYVEYVDGETLASLLASIGADARTTHGTGVGADGTERRFGLADPLPSGLQVLRLELPERRAVARMVWINGLVTNPGVYPLDDGMTAKQLVDKAGGLVVPAESVVVVSIRREWPYLQAGRNAGLENTTQYSEVRLALLGHQALMRGNYAAENALLQPGDTVNVNRVERVVWLGGQVARTGFVPWVEGWEIDDYVAAAGGYAGRPWKSRIQVYDFFTHQRIMTSQIRPGSTILVPERRYIYPDQWVTILATVASLGMAVYTIYLQTSAN